VKRNKWQKRPSLMKMVDSPLIIPHVIGAEIDYMNSARKRKQKSGPFGARQMKKELDSSEALEAGRYRRS
jgi:hypothetical protein